MSTKTSKFVWYELMTTDVSSATVFYGAVIGWTVTEAGIDRPYSILNVDGMPVGGLFTLPPEVANMGARPNWIGYIGVEDVDATATRIVENGGGIYRPGENIPGVGRFAVVHDPDGAAFVLFNGGEGMTAPARSFAPGNIGWHEYHAVDREAGFAFYADLFGWTKAEAIDMGPMGTYQLFATGGDAVGGMMTKSDAIPMPFWLYYITVAEIHAAVARVMAAGGQVLNGPMQVPGGMWVAQCLDLQGAAFAMVGPAA